MKRDTVRALPAKRLSHAKLQSWSQGSAAAAVARPLAAATMPPTSALSAADATAPHVSRSAKSSS